MGDTMDFSKDTMGAATALLLDTVEKVKKFEDIDIEPV